MKRVRLFFLCSLIGIFLPALLAQAAGREKEGSFLSPEPKVFMRLSGEFKVTKSVNLLGLDHVEPSSGRNLLAFLRENGFRVNEMQNSKDVTIILRKAADAPEPAMPASAKRKAGLKAEGYLLHVEKKANEAGRIILEGNDDTGVFYGIQTLKQLLRQDSLSALHMEDYPELKARGVVEGFYGQPWTHEDRLAQLRFYGENKLNTYIYAPKDDPYHRAKWREPYPKSELKRMRELIDAARENKVNFVFAISPGIDIRFTGKAGAEDLHKLLEKLESLYQMGVRSFAVYYDDIEDKSGKEQAALLNMVKREFVDKKGDVQPLLTVPTEYFSHDMADEHGVVKPYTEDFAKTVAQGIDVMYTGPGVVCEGIGEADLAAVERIYGRKMAVWWNYPVNDYLLNKLALGPVYGLDGQMAKYSDYFVMNPMEHAELSKIALQTGAEYAWDPKMYDAENAWRKALDMQYGVLADAMAVLAEHASYMDKGWAKAGRPDAPELRGLMDDFFKKLAQGRPADGEIARLYEAFDKMERASRQLEERLTAKQFSAARPHIALLGKLAAYDKEALKMLEAKLHGDRAAYRGLREKTKLNLQEAEASWAKLSEETAVYFLRESLKK